jgi:deoxyribodipyrimidine photo-lyase
MSQPCATLQSAIPARRLRATNENVVRPERDFILYWMTAFRRTRYNFALQRALEWSNHFRKPLLILEALRVNYPWASDRFHRFIMDGMVDNARACARSDVSYFPYIEPEPGAGKGLLAALAGRACVVVADDYPAFFLPAAVEAAAERLDVRLEAVDANGLHELRGPGRAFDTAYAFRRWLHEHLPDELTEAPVPDPLEASCSGHAPIPSDILARWPSLGEAQLSGFNLRMLAIDHGVPPVSVKGGSCAAATRLADFLACGLPAYAKERRHPDRIAGSMLSPYLHFGHISSYEILAALGGHEGWSIDRITPIQKGRRSGFWGMSDDAEAFLDQLVTWRELGFNFCAYRPDYDRFESLPQWAVKTLALHERDARLHIYDLPQLERAQSADRVWNAAQVQLIQEGVIHNYLRMLWGKRILEWTPSPRCALDVMIHLNNKYAIDGRDPNSYSGIFWTLGRYDRPWGPERPIFGTVRYMSSSNTLRKLTLDDYLAHYQSRSPT